MVLLQHTLLMVMVCRRNLTPTLWIFANGLFLAHMKNRLTRLLFPSAGIRRIPERKSHE